ncbi:transposase [Methanolobus halotolerans]|uniref:Tc1-like transposase DDE domain-containing protein n=1 Tax=Methanolobus halotolerans TaxID=2052935 RepID=A0A4E0PW93_9EURY|nr:hypothetical protein CUN85_06080 [Methanolobus halotolerans]
MKEFQIATGGIVIIIDNFRAHHAKKTVAKAQEPGIELSFLPPYSSNLNPIESIWKSVKRVIQSHSSSLKNLKRNNKK